MKYDKPVLTVSEQIDLLKSRNLVIDNPARAEKYLKNIGYYRLSGYMYHLQSDDGSHEFEEEITFNEIVQHYHFDKKLRSLFSEYLERIEVCLRAKLTNHFSLEHGFYWYTNYDLYDDKAVYNRVNDKIAEDFIDPQERFLKSFKNKYTSESLPPSNMAMEMLSLGSLTRLFNGLSNDDEKQAIAKDFGLPSTILSTWFTSIAILRNICAHHGRLWNRKLTAYRPTIPRRKEFKFNGSMPKDFHYSIYGAIAIVDRLLMNTNSNNRFVEKIINLIEEYPIINISYMGFPEDWKENPAWKRKENQSEKTEEYAKEKVKEQRKASQN